MKNRESRRYEIFQRVTTFGQTNTADFAAGSKAATGFAALATINDSLKTAQTTQKPGRDTSRETLVDEIRLDVENIARTAKAINLDEPGFADDYRLPQKFNPASWLVTADKFILQLAVQPGDDTAMQTALVAGFVAHEMDAGFVTHLQSDRAAVDAEFAQRENKRETGVGSTATIGSLIEQGVEVVATLNAIMHNKYAGQPTRWPSG